MRMAILNLAVLNGAKSFFKNPLLRMKDIREWSPGKIETRSGEVVAFVPEPGAWVAIIVDQDKRQVSK